MAVVNERADNQGDMQRSCKYFAVIVWRGGKPKLPKIETITASHDSPRRV